MLHVKICGITRAADLHAANALGANYIGLNFVKRSPRFLEIAHARELALAAPAGLAKIGLFVDADDGYLRDVLKNVPLDMLQLHGKETGERAAELRQETGLPIVKAIGVESADDLARIKEYPAADMFLLDAKPPEGALPGGSGITINWALLRDARIPKPWFLAGGLDAGNVREAIAASGAGAVDTASGVESAPGIKDEGRMEAFIKAARASLPHKED